MRSRTTSRCTTPRMAAASPSSTSTHPLRAIPGITCAWTSQPSGFASARTASLTSSSRTAISKGAVRSGSGRRPTASRCSTTSSTGISQPAVHEVEDTHRLREQRVIAAGLLLGPLQHRLQAFRFRRDDAADVEVVDGCADGGERRIVLESKARDQDFEGHAILHVGEFSAVVVEADRVLRTLARASDPGELRVAIDEPFDEPRAGEAIDPG